MSLKRKREVTDDTPGEDKSCTEPGERECSSVTTKIPKIQSPRAQHYRLFIKLYDEYITPESPEYKKFQCMCETWLCRRVIANCQDVLDLLRALEMVNVLGVGNYETLKELLEPVSVSAIRAVEEHERKNAALQLQLTTTTTSTTVPVPKTIEHRGTTTSARHTFTLGGTKFVIEALDKDGSQVDDLLDHPDFERRINEEMALKKDCIESMLERGSYILNLKFAALEGFLSLWLQYLDMSLVHQVAAIVREFRPGVHIFMGLMTTNETLCRALGAFGDNFLKEKTHMKIKEQILGTLLAIIDIEERGKFQECLQKVTQQLMYQIDQHSVPMNPPVELPVFLEPIPLIFSDKMGKLATNSSALDQLEQIEQPLNIVAIAGLYRTGKSYLMNRLAGNNQGFRIGSTMRAQTKGIWVWCLPHPVYPDQVLVLLDTEGLGNIHVDQGDHIHDGWIFALAILLSSTLVYNTFGALDQHAIEEFYYVTEMSKHIQARTNDMSNTDYDLYFPALVVALRDFSLQLFLDDGTPLTPDEYLEFCLNFRSENVDQYRKFNQQRKCIRRYFTERKCFTFDRPVHKRNQFAVIGELGDDKLDEDFVEDVRTFSNYVHENGKPKQLHTGSLVTGKMFVDLVKTYVDAIRNDSVPCIENAIITTSIHQNKQATEDAISRYRSSMINLLEMPTRYEVLVSAHEDSFRRAMTLFSEKAVFHEGNGHLQTLKEQLMKEFDAIRTKNEAASEQECREVLQRLYLPITEKIIDGTYTGDGGYTIYQNDLQQLRSQYIGQRGHGVKTKDTILAFLDEKCEERRMILVADATISEEQADAAEKQIAIQTQQHQESVMRESKLIDERARRRGRELLLEMEKLTEKRHEENLQKYYDDAIKRRVEEQRRTENEGFTEDAEAMQQHINQLKLEKVKRMWRRS